MLRNAEIIEVQSLSELGIYSCLFIDEKEVLTNFNFGTLIRTKGSHANEGGVNAGFAVIDTPVLFEAQEGCYEHNGEKGVIKPNVAEL